MCIRAPHYLHNWAVGLTTVRDIKVFMLQIVHSMQNLFLSVSNGSFCRKK